MKEVTYEEWQKNPTPRMMWVWDSNESNKNKRKVIYFLENKDESFPVIALDYDGTIPDNYKHCAEIEEPKTRRMTHKELSWWIREKSTREWTFIFQKPARAHTVFEYFDNETNQPVDDNIVVREDGGEWHEPLVEVEE